MSERYEIKGKLGRGGMSAIYRGFDTVMGREVAIKRLLPLEKTNLNEDAGNVLEKEAAALAKFQHPNIVTVYAIEEDADGPFVVMELVDGEDLHFVLTEGALSWDDFQDVARQCLEPLTEAQELGLLHRDIKPGNIMVTMTPSEKFLVKILDFGLAKFSQQPSMQTLDQAGSFLGSIDFIAPEQLELRPLDQRTDLYSLGCVLYFSLAQKSPFTGENPAETTKNHLKHDCIPIHELRPEIPEPVADWLMKMISRRPADRPRDAVEALELFHAAVAGESPLASTPEEAPDEEGSEHSPSSAPVTPPPPESEPVWPPPESEPVLHLQESEPVIPSVHAVESGPVVAAPGTGSISEPGSSPSTSRQPVLPAPRTGPVRKVAFTKGATGAIGQPGRRNAYTAKRGAFPKKTARFPLWLRVVLGILILALGLKFFFRGDPEPSVESEKGKEVERPPEKVAEPSSKPPPLKELSYPTQKFRMRPSSGVAPIEFDSGLVARYLAGQQVYGRNNKDVPDSGEQVALWGNVRQRKPEALLIRDFQDKTGKFLPTLIEFGPEKIPTLQKPTTAIAFNNKAFIKSRSNHLEVKTGATLVAVGRFEPGSDRFFKLVAEPYDKRMIALGSGRNGVVEGMCKIQSNGKEFRVTVGSPTHHAGVYLYSIDLQNGKHRVSVVDTRNGKISTKSGQFSDRMGPQAKSFSRVTVGKRAFQEKTTGKFTSGFFEALVYDHALSEKEGDQLIGELLGRYFKTK